MSTLMEELTAIKAVEDKLTANKVANFAYTDHAYNNPLTEADGVASYDPDAEQNIPNANASTLQVNSTILTKGWRAQASSITRMLMNHFLGRCSYNLNKINDLFSTLLTKLMAYMGAPNGLATLDENGYVPSNQLDITKESLGLGNVVNTGDSDTPVQNGTTKFTTGGAYSFIHNGIKVFSPNTACFVGDLVWYNGEYYKTTTYHLGEWNSSHFRYYTRLIGSVENFVTGTLGLSYDSSKSAYILDRNFIILVLEGSIKLTPRPHSSMQAIYFEGFVLSGNSVTSIQLARGLSGVPDTYTTPSGFSIVIGAYSNNDVINNLHTVYEFIKAER